ncbi:hypothetical protein CDL12_29801 [Handroanthus impetiginosus]|uniref:RING-CH-type domain-containing protein n=1 Tax=Handroanthus impetiginosus TaxID=429701 RepID=A0A2G9FXE6_9LAMI|nr:hypothetical protein CDL12_29801 [Handroanthus impetiginosus]
MASLEASQIDLERGRRSSADVGDAASVDGSVCFSDGEEGSCNSQFYSTADGDGSFDDYISEIESRRASSVSVASDCSVDIEKGGIVENKVCLRKVLEGDCRICHLSLVSNSPGSGIAIELGCSCKDDLAAAHKHCAETWFKIKGNKTCEICNSIARNVICPIDIEAAQQASEINIVTSTTSSAPPPSRSCLNGHRFLNFLLACMVFAFVISWLFHFNIPS